VEGDLERSGARKDKFARIEKLILAGDRLSRSDREGGKRGKCWLHHLKGWVEVKKRE